MILNEEGEAVGTTTADMSVHTQKMGTPSKRKKSKKEEEEEMSNEFHNGHKMYTEGHLTIFELEKADDLNIFFECFRKKDPRNMYQREALNECLDQYNKSTKAAFIVRYGDTSYQMQQMFKNF